MSAVEIRNLGRVNALVISEEAAVEMESALDAVAVEDIDQTAVKRASIVIGHGQSLEFSTGIALIYFVHASNNLHMHRIEKENGQKES